MSRPQVQPRDWPSTDGSYTKTHHMDISEFCNAALAGCRTCIDLWRHFFKNKTPEEYAEQPYFNTGKFAHVYFGSGTSYRFLNPGDALSRGTAFKPGTMVLEFSLNSPLTKGAAQKFIAFRRLDAGDEPDNAHKLGTNIHVSTRGLQRGMNVISLDKNAQVIQRWSHVQRWMSECISSHPMCKMRRRSPGFLPTRLLYVPFGPMPPEPRYRLVDMRTQHLDWLGHSYLTLSHVWGRNPDPRWETRLQNVAERLAVGIHRDNLSQSFQDAVDAAARLQVPYLWIDSLCIIQDDDKDKHCEISAMQQVYSNAFVNLSATSAANGHEGLTSSYELHPRTLWTFWGKDDTAEQYQIIDLSFWRDRVTETTINSRGWVLQERVLAPRVLHFGFDQLLWECCDLAAAEEFPSGIPGEFLGDYAGFKQKANVLVRAELDQKAAAMVNLDDKAAEYRRYHKIWQQLVGPYGDSELTKPEDKLPAISGLARTVHEHLGGDEYLAGLWRRSLLSDLLWIVEKTQRRIRGTTADGMYEKTWEASRRATAYRAPSWSWASVDGELTIPTLLDFSGAPMQLSDKLTITARPMAAVLEATTTPLVPGDTFGQICDGRLVIKGQMHRLGVDHSMYTPMPVFRVTGEPVTDHIDEPVAWTLYDEAYFLPLALQVKRWDPLPENLVRLSKVVRENITSNMNLWHHSKTEDNEWATKIQRARAELLALDNGEYWDTVAGLLICPTEDRTAFRRFGHMEVNVHKFQDLQATAGATEFRPEEASPTMGQTRFTPENAATWGDVVTGIVEIV